MKTRSNYVHKEVFGCVTPELASQASEFWERNGVIPKATERMRRARQLAAVVFDESGKISGVGTAYPDTITADGRALDVFMYRTFIEPGKRTPLLFLSLFFTACSALEKACGDGSPSQVAFFTENRKFTRRGVVKRVFESYGAKLLGEDNRGQSYWVYPLFWDGPHRKPVGLQRPVRQPPR